MVDVARTPELAGVTIVRNDLFWIARLSPRCAQRVELVAGSEFSDLSDLCGFNPK